MRFLFEIQIGTANCPLEMVSHDNGSETIDPRPLRDHMDPQSAQRLVVALINGAWMGEIQMGDTRLHWFVWNCDLITDDSFPAEIHPVALEA